MSTGPDSTPNPGSSPRARRPRRNSDDGTATTNSYSGVPYRDATPGTAEVPLEELDTFIVPGRDEKGITQNVSFNIPPYMDQYIQVILRSGRFPYINVGSVFRHAMVRHLRWMSEIRQSVPPHIVPTMEILLEICRDNEMRIRVEDALEQISKQIQTLHSRGDFGEAIRLAAVIKGRMEKVHSSAWQRRFVTEFNGLHAALMSRGARDSVQDEANNEIKFLSPGPASNSEG